MSESPSSSDASLPPLPPQSPLASVPPPGLRSPRLPAPPSEHLSQPPQPSPAHSAALTPQMQTGQAAERAAEAFLLERGHRLLERNWRAGRDEIDLITVDGPCVVFVEVRARQQGALVGGYHSIDKRKKTALRRVCRAYLNRCHPRPHTYRLDVVQITLGKGGQMEIVHYANIALF